MTWQGVPWAIGTHVGGTPQTPAEAARALAYHAFDGAEGPAAAGDCRVLALAVPGPSVRIMPGTVAILNRFPGGAGQAYLVRQPEEEVVPITATGAGGGRTDLVAVVVEDPQYAGQPTPPDAANGPYVRTVVYEGVAADTTRLDQVDADQSGYALARVTLPVSTGTVQTAHITDLRSLAKPKTQQVTKLLSIGAQADVLNTAAAYERFPEASWAIPVPSWAVKAHLELYVAGVRVSNDATEGGNWTGKGRLKLGSVVTQDVELNPTPPAANQKDTFTYVAAGEFAIPAGMRGTTQTLEPQAHRTGSTSGVTVAQGWGTTVVAKVTFYEDVSLDSFTV